MTSSGIRAPWEGRYINIPQVYDGTYLGVIVLGEDLACILLGFGLHLQFADLISGRTDALAPLSALETPALHTSISLAYLCPVSSYPLLFHLDTLIAEKSVEQK